MPKKKSVTAPEPNLADLAEFQRLFWAARAAHRKLRKKTNTNIPEHVAATQYAEARGWTWGVELLTALMLTYQDRDNEALQVTAKINVPFTLRGDFAFLQGLAHYGKREYDNAIAAYLQALQTPMCGHPGVAWHNLGLAYTEKKEYGEAIRAYRQALATPGYDRLGDAWHRMGIAHAERKEYDQAIEAHRKALATPGYDAPGDAWFRLGWTYDEKKEYDQAIEAYRQALAAPGYDTPGDAWYNIGISYHAKKEYDQASEAYRQALATPGYDAAGDSWNNLGLIYAEKKKKYDQAIEAYKNALATPGYDTPRLTELNLASAYRLISRYYDAEALVRKVLEESNSEGQHDRARLLLSLIEADKKSIQTKPGEEALAAPSPTSFGDGPESRMKALLTKRENRYEMYLKNRPKAPLPDDFTVLRGWSSAVTLLEGSQNSQWRGGGYLLQWRGHGIVIDPGFDFVDNLHDAGFHGTSIRAVAVSHNHPDHNYDLVSLDDLYYELHRRDDSLKPALFVMDEDTGRLFPDNSPKHRGSACKMTRSDHERSRWQGGPKENLPFTIEHFPVFHGDDVPHALGLRFRLHSEDAKAKDLVVGYTGDAKFTPELVEHLRGVDVLIAHVSQPDEREFNDPDFLKDVHLGYNGVTKLVKEIKPKLTLVGEFWAGLADLRLDLVAGIRQRSGVPTVLPACLGLRLRLPEMTVRCTRCQKQTPADKLKVAPPIREFGELGYLCPECIL
jgi:tetratricopeptide (TPR) repeat protein